MQLQYTNATNTIIKATLDEGETLGNQTGPTTFFVPTDPANAVYAKILAEGYLIEAAPPQIVPTLDSIDTGKTAAEILGAT